MQWKVQINSLCIPHWELCMSLTHSFEAGNPSACCVPALSTFFPIHVNIHPHIYYKTVCQETIVKNGNNLYCRQYYIVKYFQWFIDKSYKLLPGYTHTIYSFWFRRGGGGGRHWWLKCISIILARISYIK